MRKLMPVWISALLLAVVTAACTASLAPTQSPDVIGTIVAGTMAAVTPAPTETNLPATAAAPTLLLPSSVSPSSFPPTLPPVVATVLVPSATRITFLTGATTGVVTAPIQAGGTQTYVLQASQGQILMVNVDSQNHDVTVSIKTQGGTSMLSAAAGQSTWQQALPQTEDYYLTIHGGATAENFTLTVTIPSRIKFVAGADSAKVTGQTVGGYNVLYAAFATKGQKMSVVLDIASGDAALTIYGYTDGTPYVRYVSEQTRFKFVLPSTQDYIIEVVPKAGSTVIYVMTVEIK
jgi:hypothetical protein